MDYFLWKIFTFPIYRLFFIKILSYRKFLVIFYLKKISQQCFIYIPTLKIYLIFSSVFIAYLKGFYIFNSFTCNKLQLSLLPSPIFIWGCTKKEQESVNFPYLLSKSMYACKCSIVCIKFYSIHLGSCCFEWKLLLHSFRVCA